MDGTKGDKMRLWNAAINQDSEEKIKLKYSKLPFKK